MLSISNARCYASVVLAVVMLVVRLTVRLTVKHLHCDKTKDITANNVTPHRSIPLYFDIIDGCWGCRILLKISAKK